MRMLATSASCLADPNRLHRQLVSVSARYHVYRSQPSLGERQRDRHREPADDRPRLVSVEHRIAVRVHDLETPCPKVSGNLLEIEPADNVARLFTLESDSELHGECRDHGPGRFGYRQRPLSDSCHLGKAPKRALEMVKAVMDVDERDRTVRERKLFDVRHDRRDPEAVAPRPFLRATRRS